MTTTELREKLGAMDRSLLMRLLGQLESKYGAWQDQDSEEQFEQQFYGLIGYHQMSSADLREYIWDWAGGPDHDDGDPDSWQLNIDVELEALSKKGPDAYQYLVNEEPQLKFPRVIAEQIAASVYDGMYISQVIEAFEQYVQLT